MNTQIALLRGINVGGKHIVPMKELTKLMEDAGYTNVKTYIQSGNVVFQSTTENGNDIGQLIEGKWGFKPHIFILSKEDLEKAAEDNPYETDEGKTVHFFFFDAEPQSPDFELLDSLKADSEEYKLIDKVFYLYAPDGIGRSKMVEKVGKAFKGVNMTARNLNTINKLLEMVS
ncbi:DUF1697 domain-containing protein [Fulvivirga sp.]|uniref:DUF1697 domain-containing protein n=1 Tax=Fulvivirga sp. TaxID=1931237 RepID=UPI0032EE2D19